MNDGKPTNLPDTAFCNDFIDPDVSFILFVIIFYIFFVDVETVSVEALLFSKKKIPMKKKLKNINTYYTIYIYN